MKKLLIALALCLLAASSFAAPPGWVDGVASKDVNAAVAADASAIHRGGALIVDHATLQQQLLPWDDGDSITLDFVLPGALSGCADTPVGWECAVDGSTWRAGVADLDGVKVRGALATAMDDFTAPGAQSYVRIPIGDVVDHGGNEWRPVEKQLGGDWQDFSFTVQPALTAQEILDGATRPDWAVGSIAIYHNSKANDINSPRGPPRYYMTGKAAHMPAPVAVGFRSNMTTITGWTYGWFEFDDQTGRIKKVFPYDVVAGWSAQTASVVVDATVGFTTIGASTLGSTDYVEVDSTALAETGEIQSWHIATEMGTVNLGSFTAGVYADAGSSATLNGEALVTDSDFYSGRDGAIFTNDVVDPGWHVGTPPANASLPAADVYCLYLRQSQDPAPSFAGSTMYDSSEVGHNITRVDGAGFPAEGSAPPDPYPTPGTYIVGRAMSIYITLASGGGGGGATDSGPLNLGLGLEL